MPEASTDLKIRKNDIILVAFIAVICIVTAFVPFLSSAEGSEVLIYKDGLLFSEKNLSENSVTDVDGLLSVVIENGYVYVVDSVCPNGECMHSKAHRAGDTIICLPNKIMIKITGESETDAVSG